MVVLISGREEFDGGNSAQADRQYPHTVLGKMGWLFCKKGSYLSRLSERDFAEPTIWEPRKSPNPNSSADKIYTNPNSRILMPKQISALQPTIYSYNFSPCSVCADHLSVEVAMDLEGY